VIVEYGMSSTILARLFALVTLVLAASMTTSAQPPVFDLVIAGGRVIDPESGLDGIRHIGIRGDRIVQISTEPLTGRDTLDAAGLVVSPGFIDLHRHAVGDNSFRYAARDGVTSTFELEIGAPDVEAWYRMMGPARLINFGVAAGHIGARMEVLGDKGFLLPTGPGRGAATPAQVQQITAQVERGLADGAVAVGIGTAYTPGASAEEIAAIVAAASRHGAFVMAHLGNGVDAFKRSIGMVSAAKASMHVAHINSTAGRDARAWLDAIAEARKQGIDVTSEMYPYTAGASLIQSALYDGWEKFSDERFAAMQWAATGERLTRETFAKYRAQGGSVISHTGSEDMVRLTLADPGPFFGSDGGRGLVDEPTHPRASGTFARILGHYVRDEKLITLPDALRRMTIEPARRLETRVPDMRDRGRIRAGAFADITVFDPATVIDRSTYTNAAVFSEGITHVVVNGSPIVRGGQFDDSGVLQGQRIPLGPRVPGRPIRAPRAAK
jgi:N-acyl-D-aspartate/D-glutamate deacylase